MQAIKVARISASSFNMLNNALDIKSHKEVGQHAWLEMSGYLPANSSDDEVINKSLADGVTITTTDRNGNKCVFFNGLIDDIRIEQTNGVRVLHTKLISRSSEMDIIKKTRTYQSSSMTYKTVTKHMAKTKSGFSILLPEHASKKIGSMLLQYNQTDWDFAVQLASRLNTVVVPDCLLDYPCISIGMPSRSNQEEISVIRQWTKVEPAKYREYISNGVKSYTKNDAISYYVESRDVFNLCDAVTLNGKTLYVFSCDTVYSGNEMIHTYCLKDKSGFTVKEYKNPSIIGVALEGEVIEVQEDQVRVRIFDDIEQDRHRWFQYSTPFSTPDGAGWYVMPVKGDEVKLTFPTENASDAYVSSSTHITHGDRSDPDVRIWRNVEGQEIRFEKRRVYVTDGNGSSMQLHKSSGITLSTKKSIKIDADENVSVSAGGKLNMIGQAGVILRQGTSFIDINKEKIEVASNGNRIN